MIAERTCPDCGFTGTYRTEALAAAYFARHSCNTHRRARAAAQARAARAAGGIRRDCQHPGGPHQHGTRTAYVKDKCHCRPCMDANAAASRTRDRDLTYGRWHPYVDANIVRAHLEVLRGAGLGRLQIAQLSGVSARWLGVIINGDHGRLQAHVREDTARRILAVQPDQANLAPNRKIDGTGTRRRLQALVALGWPVTWLARRLGRHATNLRRALHSDEVTARTAADVTRLYEHLEHTRPQPDTPRGRRAIADALALAAKHNWLTPGAWDDIDHDPEPPAPTPRDAEHVDALAVAFVLSGEIRPSQLTPAEQAVAVQLLTERGKSVRDIAEQLATSTRTVSRRRRTNAA
jgi:transposase-like protein